MRVVSAQDISNKRVLLRLDLDVTLHDTQGKLEVGDDFRLKAGIPTLELCLESASQIIIMGHLGRPDGRVDHKLSVAPIWDWLGENGFKDYLGSGKLKLLENLRFEKGEEESDLNYSQELASLGEVFINEAFGSWHPASSTTVLPTLLPSFAGLRFAQEVKSLTEVRNNPEHPLVVIIGGAKVEDKLPVVLEMAKRADIILVGGRLPEEMKKTGKVAEISRLHNVFVANLNEQGVDITQETVKLWGNLISKAKTIIWNGPLGQVEHRQNSQSLKIAQLIIDSRAKSVVGGGDTTTYLDQNQLLDKFSFVSTGGGAMLEFLVKGTLPTIKVLE